MAVFRKSDEPMRLQLGPGWYRVRVKDAGEKVSQKGDAYFNAVLVASDFGPDTFLCYDVIMLAGDGVGIGGAKLHAMGLDPEDGETIVPEQIVGWEGLARVVESTFNGRKRLEVDIGASESCGYLSMDDEAQVKVVEPTETERRIIAAEQLDEQPAPEKPEPAAVAEEDDEDVPF